MSHVVTIATKVRDPVAIAVACRRLHLPEAEHGTAHLYSGEATGWFIRLPEWQYPAVVDTANGSICYDNFEGRWGDQACLDRFLQAYAVEKTLLEAHKKGCLVAEQAQADGSIHIRITEVAA
jgi:hypothetical protein